MMNDNQSNSDMKSPKTVEEFRVDGKVGRWQIMGYRETREEAKQYKEELEESYGGMFDRFRIRSVMVKWEESEQYLKERGKGIGTY